MESINWRGVDLNLLIAFAALMETRSVTKAAEKLSIGQSAMSHNLSRLRTLINDPLFERRGHHMVATDKAKELAPVIEQVLQLITSEILQPKIFTPEADQSTIRIGLIDYAELLFAPVLFDAILSQAPNCQLSFHKVDRHNYQAVMEDQDIHLVIGSMAQLPRDLDSQYLYTEDHVCLFDSQATGLRAPVDLARYIQTPQALVTPDGKLVSAVDQQLQAQGFSRHVAVGSGNFLTIRHLLSGRNLLCVVSTLMARITLFNDDLTQCPPPVTIPDFDIRMIWRKRNANHPRLIWLRQCVAQTVKTQVTHLRQQPPELP